MEVKRSLFIVVIVSFFALCLTNSSIYAIVHQNAFFQKEGCTSISPHLLDNASSPDKQSPTIGGGYYTITDVYPSGRRVKRGTALFGEKPPSLSQDENYTHPLGSEYYWFPGRQGLYTFIKFGNSNYYAYNAIVTPDGSNKVNSETEWYTSEDISHFYDPKDIIDTIDYGDDGKIDLISPCARGIAIINISTGKALYTIPLEEDIIVCDLAVGNIDNDSSTEIVILCYSGDDCTFLTIYDDWSTNFTLLKVKDLVPYADDGDTAVSFFSSIFLSDVDNDGRDEILVGLVQDNPHKPAKIIVIDDKEGKFYKQAITSEGFDYYEFGVCLRIYAAYEYDGRHKYIIAYYRNKFVFYTYDAENKEINYVTFNGWDPNDPRPHLVFTNVDGDPREEAIYVKSSYSPYDASTVKFTIYILNLKITKTSPYIKTIEEELFSQKTLFDFDAVVSPGNYDEDGYNELSVTYFYSDDDGTKMGVYFYDDFTTKYNLMSRGMIGSSRLNIQEYASFHNNTNECGLTSDEKMNTSTDDTQPVVVSVPVSLEDNMLVEYAGHNQSTSDPYIIAVMAAPPTIANISQNYVNSATLFGTAVSQSTTEGNGYSVSTGVALSFEAGIRSIASVEFSVTLSTAFERTNTITQTIQECREFQGDYSHDYVIFEAVTYDNYYYTIITHHNNTMVGKKFAISVPNQPAVYKWSLSYFNENNGDAADIGNETFNHTIGKVWTYPSTDVVKEYLSKYKDTGFWKSGSAITVGSGSGVNSIEIDLENEETSEITTTMSVEFEEGFSVAGVGLSASVGISTSYIYSVTIGTSTKYRGDIGDISPEDYDIYKYSTGLFIYNLYRKKDHLAYQVVNYWVEGYTGPTEISNNTNTINSNTNASSGGNLFDNIYSFFKNLDNTTKGIIGGTIGILILGTITIKIFKPKKKPKTRTRGKK